MTIIWNIEMSRGKVCIYIVFFFALVGCEYNDHSTENTMGINTAEKIIDTVTMGRKQYYYIDDTLRSVATIINGKKNGIAKEFYPDGNIKTIGVFKDNKPDSVATWFYNNGNTLKTASLINGSYFGRHIEYYPNKNLKTIKLTHFNAAVFSRSLDSTGNISEDVGKPYTFIYNKNDLTKNSPFEIIIFVAELYPLSINFNISLYNSNNKRLLTTVVNKDFTNTIYGRRYIYQTNNLPIGKSQLILTYTLKDEKYNKTYSGNDTLGLSVKKSED